MLALFAQGASSMIRKLLLPALATALLAGCVTGYQYRGGAGDYYYGQPSTQYRYYGSPYGYYGYGYPGGWGGSIGYGYGYSPYGYYGYGGYPYYRHHYPYRPPVVIVQPGSGGNDHGNNGNGNDQGAHENRPRPPWRDLGNIPGRRVDPEPAIRQPPRQVSTPMPRTVPAARTGGRSSSATGGMVRRTDTERDKRRNTTP
jgi:hypothetical protein